MQGTETMIQAKAAELLRLIGEARAEVERLDEEAEGPDGETWTTNEIEEHHQAIGYLEGLSDALKTLTA